MPNAPPVAAQNAPKTHVLSWGLTARPSVAPPGPGPLPAAIMIGQLAQGGSERQLFMFLARCDRALWSPILFVSGELGPWEGPVRALGIPVVLLTGSPLAKIRQFRAACRVLKPACFFSWSSYTNVYGLALPRGATRRIGSFRNALFADLPSRMRGAWIWASLAGISVAVCNSAETLDGLRARSARPLPLYVPNGVEIPRPDEVEVCRRRWRGALGLAPADVLVLGVGRLAAQKNFALFVDVIAQVVRETPVRAAIAGDDMGELANLEDRVERLGLGSAVSFLGRVPDARQVICAADVVLLTSDHEGMPNVVLEAMAAGVACVATRVNGVGDLLRCGQTGFLAPPRDAPSLAAHVTRLAHDPELRRRIGEAARVAVAQGHDPDAVAERLWALCGSEIVKVRSEEQDAAASVGVVRA